MAPGLDFVLGGGLPPDRLYLLEGDPGTGNTTLAMQFLLEGVLLFRIGGAEPHEFEARAGEVICIPGNVPHEAVALEDSICLDVFSPPRQDWLDGTDDYFRR